MIILICDIHKIDIEQIEYIESCELIFENYECNVENKNDWFLIHWSFVTQNVVLNQIDFQSFRQIIEWQRRKQQCFFVIFIFVFIFVLNKIFEHLTKKSKYYTCKTKNKKSNKSTIQKIFFLLNNNSFYFHIIVFHDFVTTNNVNEINPIFAFWAKAKCVICKNVQFKWTQYAWFQCLCNTCKNENDFRTF